MDFDLAFRKHETPAVRSAEVLQTKLRKIVESNPLNLLIPGLSFQTKGLIFVSLKNCFEEICSTQPHQSFSEQRVAGAVLFSAVNNIKAQI